MILMSVAGRVFRCGFSGSFTDEVGRVFEVDSLRTLRAGEHETCRPVEIAFRDWRQTAAAELKLRLARFVRRGGLSPPFGSRPVVRTRKPRCARIAKAWRAARRWHENASRCYRTPLGRSEEGGGKRFLLANQNNSKLFRI